MNIQPPLVRHMGEVGRFYTVPSDQQNLQYFSVTTILQKSKNQGDDRHLVKWNLENPGVANQKAVRGTRFHLIVDEAFKIQIYNRPMKEIKEWLVIHLLKNSTEVEREENKELYRLFLKVIPLLKSTDEVLATELPLHHPRLFYAGTADTLLRMGGILVMADWKTSDTPKKNMYDNPLQITAYIQAYNELYGKELGYCSAGLIINVPVEGDLKLHYYDPAQLNKYWIKFKHRLSIFRSRYCPVKYT